MRWKIVAAVWVLVGALVTIASLLFQPHYQALCERVNDPFPCSPVSNAMMLGYALIMLGVASLFFAPIFLTLGSEAAGDRTQIVWRWMNVGLIFGALYIAVGLAILITTT